MLLILKQRKCLRLKGSQSCDQKYHTSYDDEYANKVLLSIYSPLLELSGSSLTSFCLLLSSDSPPFVAMSFSNLNCVNLL